MHQRGKALRFQQEFGEAIKAFTDAIQLIPTGSESNYLAEAYLKRGICWSYQGDGELARGDFEQAAAISYEDPLPHLWMGFTYAQDGEFRRAIESYGEAISRSPNFALPYVNRGLAYMHLEDYEKALRNFNHAVRNEPSNAKHFVKRGLAQMRLSDYQKAFDSAELAILNDENNAEAYRLAAEALRQLGRDSLAEQYESRVRQIETSGAQASQR